MICTRELKFEKKNRFENSNEQNGFYQISEFQNNRDWEACLTWGENLLRNTLDLLLGQEFSLQNINDPKYTAKITQEEKSDLFQIKYILQQK